MRSKKFDDNHTKTSKKTVVCVSIAVILILAALSLFGYCAVRASTDNIYHGLSVGKLELGGMDKSEALKQIVRAYDGDEITVNLKCEDVYFEVYGSQIGLSPDFDATADEAIRYGKDGNIFVKIKNMLELKKNPHRLNLRLKCDLDALQYRINECLSDKIVDVQHYSVEIGDNCIIVSNGKSGKTADAMYVLECISNAITNGKSDEVIEFELREVQPEKIDGEKFYEQYNREAENAQCIQSDDDLTITPEIIGISLNKAETLSILKENEKNSEVYTIPAVITYPQITAAELEAEYTDTMIGTYSTSYSSSSANRKENIRLASSKISGLILNPGEVFSFNDVVGPRTEAAGFKTAHVYIGNEISDGIGGGICQVSSTLYNAVVFADLEIVYRRNHSIPVSYTPLGRDATVSYGSIDFRFKNNKSTPIKLELIADGSALTVNVYGRKKYLKDISIETAVTGTIPFSTTEIKDDTMYEGEKRVEKAGTNGTKVEAYKIIKENGETASRTLLSRSTYSPTSAVVRVGTRKKEVQVTEQPTSAPVTPEPSTETVSPQIEPTESEASSADIGENHENAEE